MHEGGVVMDVAVGPGKEFRGRRDMWEGNLLLPSNKVLFLGSRV